MINSQQDLSDKLDLVRWEEQAPRRYFDLTTIHSLTIDSNPKFKELKEIIQKYNEQQRPDRIRYQQKYIQNLFKMLSQLSRISLFESQVQYLQKIYKWAFNGQSRSEKRGQGFSKSRPATATTRTRPTTAFSRPPTGISRPTTAKLTALRTKQQVEEIIMNKDDPRIDYNKLKPGEQQFYAGIRTLHHEYANPKKRLKQYQRNVFYQDQPDSDVQIIDLDQKQKPTPLKQLKISQEQLIDELQAGQEGQEGQEGAQGQQGAQGLQAGEANIDDILLQGEEGAAEVQQEKQIIDKLKPRLKAYGCPQNQKINKKNYQDGMQHYIQQRYYKQRKINQDNQIAFLQTKWAQLKAKSNSQMRKRAQSARLVTKNIGVAFKKKIQPNNAENIINFQNVTPIEVNAKGSRPHTAFRADNPKNRQQLIKNAFLTGKLISHVQNQSEHTQKQGKTNITSFTAKGEKPKKRNFEDILKEAEERVAKQAQDEIENVKQTLAKAKVSIGANRIAKSISYYDRQLPDVWVGGVAGMGMLKNPFIKVTKKKKKKKKK